MSFGLSGKRPFHLRTLTWFNPQGVVADIVRAPETVSISKSLGPSTPNPVEHEPLQRMYGQKEGLAKFLIHRWAKPGGTFDEITPGRISQLFLQGRLILNGD